jgi:glycosyltransferase involved in cell wall biosynthesis
VGNNGFYKNRAGAIRLFNRIRTEVDCRLIMAGPPPDESLLTMIRERSLAEHVEFAIDPTDTEICQLYRLACLLLFPSYYEGFGWPPLEAMAWGCPVVSSRNGSLAEMVGDAALTTDVEDEATMAAHALQLLQNQTITTRLVSAGMAQVQRFSLAEFRRNLLEVYHSLD